MTKKKQQDEPVKLSSLYGDTEPTIGEYLEHSNQYKKAREVLLEKGLVKPEELAVMTDSDVETQLDWYFSFVCCRDNTVAIIRRADIPAFESMLILLKK